MQKTLKHLRDTLTPVYGPGETEAIIRLIFHYLKGWSAVDIIINENKALSDYMLQKIADIENRLLNHEPIQYIVGEAYFYGMEFDIDRNVLIPRPETEELIDFIIHANGRTDLQVLDIGTGSGCIAIALSRNLPFSRVTAIDNSTAALDVARHNAKKFKANINFIEADIFGWEPEPSSLDIIVSNPPYVCESEKEKMDDNVLLHEPASALFVPDDNPLLYYRRIGIVARKALVPGGRMYLEINPLHADALRALLTSQGFTDIEVRLDIHGRKRFLYCVRPEAD